MLTVQSPYFQIQAIRKELRDRGIATIARPYFGYHAICNLANSPPLANERAKGTVSMDNDSYFAWISTYLYYQDVPWIDYESIGQVQDAESGRYPIVRIKMQNLRTGRRYHTPDFIDPNFLDWYQAGSSAGGGIETNPESEIWGDGTSQAFGSWRCVWPEIVLLEPREQLLFEVLMPPYQVIEDTQQGYVFWMCGVRLYPGRA